MFEFFWRLKEERICSPVFNKNLVNINLKNSNQEMENQWEEVLFFGTAFYANLIREDVIKACHWATVNH